MVDVFPNGQEKKSQKGGKRKLCRVMMGGFPLLIPDDPPPKKPTGKEK